MGVSKKLSLAGCVQLILIAAMIFFAGFASYRKVRVNNHSFTFVQICDPHLGKNGNEKEKAVLRQLVRQVNLKGAELVFICGDLTHNGDEKSLKQFIEIASEFNMPWYCVPGNHDIGKKPTAESLERYRKTVGADYFAVEHKGATFLLVNTSLWYKPVKIETERQDAWLRKSLKAAGKKGNQIFIVAHYPLFVEKITEWNSRKNLPKGNRLELLELFTEHKVAAVLGGHLHRLTINDYKNIQLVNAESIKFNYDKRPFGFRVWTVKSGEPPTHEFVALDNSYENSD